MSWSVGLQEIRSSRREQTARRARCIAIATRTRSLLNFATCGRPGSWTLARCDVVESWKRESLRETVPYEEPEPPNKIAWGLCGTAEVNMKRR